VNNWRSRWLSRNKVNRQRESAKKFGGDQHPERRVPLPNVDSTKAMLILSPCRKRSPFRPQNLTLSNVKRRNFWGALIGLGRAVF